MSDKPNLQPPSQPRTFASDPHASRFKIIAMFGFSILAIVAFAVVMFLPDRVATQSSHIQVTAEIDPVLSEIRVAEQSALKTKEAQDLLKQLLTLQARLENEGVKIWGAQPLVTSYKEVLDLLEETNGYFDGHLFDQATKGYREVIAKLEQLAASRPERIRRAMQTGDEALAQLDSPLAKQHYELVLAADSGNHEAQVGIQRAIILPQVLENFTQGQVHEGNDKLDLAKQMYNNAILLDKDFQPAREHLQRVDALILDRDFQRSVSDAISALHREDISPARRALDIAQKLQPNSETVRDLERQLIHTEQRVAIQQLEKQALQYEQTEQWEKAAKVYIKVLNIDANTGFAQQGKLRTEKYLELSQQVQHYLSHPDDLQASESMIHARNICDFASTTIEIGPTFRSNIVKLRQLIDAYNQPISILIHSDDMTNVRINRVGRLGQFLEHRLTLQPGRYKAIGTRSGYRDVNIMFAVPVASKEVTLMVSCKDKI